MKIKIDTAQKVITIEDELVSLSELFMELEKAVPNWKEYRLQGVQKEISVVPYQPLPYIPINPWAPTIDPMYPYYRDGFTICEVIN